MEPLNERPGDNGTTKDRRRSSRTVIQTVGIVVVFCGHIVTVDIAVRVLPSVRVNRPVLEERGARIFEKSRGTLERRTYEIYPRHRVNYTRRRTNPAGRNVSIPKHSRSTKRRDVATNTHEPHGPTMDPTVLYRPTVTAFLPPPAVTAFSRPR